MGDELKWLLKEGGGRIFESCYISLESTPTSHSLALVICACNDSAMPLLSCACLCNNSKWLVHPLAQCCLPQLGGVLLREEHPLQQLHSKKGGGHIFKGGFIFGRLRYVTNFYCTDKNINMCM